MGVGINLKDLTDDPRITLTATTVEGVAENGKENFDDWIYTIDIDQFDGDPDQIITILGDWHRSDDESVDGNADTNGGEYVTAPIPNPSGSSLYFGDLNVDFQTGAMEWSFTYQDLLDNAGLNFDVYFVGKYGNQLSDSDLVRIVITCFLPGTLIATPSGDSTIESLAIGDSILTSDGREVAVKWIGRKTMKTSVFLDDTMLPVCVSAGAFGNGLPHQDLYLSANHGIIMGDALVNAGALVNDATIRFVALADMPATFTYYHIETEAHDEILANGAPVETFVDYVGRKGFDNYDEYVALYGCDRIIPEMKRLRISSRRQLPRELLERMGIGEFTETVSAEVTQFLAKNAA